MGDNVLEEAEDGSRHLLVTGQHAGDHVAHLHLWQHGDHVQMEV